MHITQERMEDLLRKEFQGYKELSKGKYIHVDVPGPCVLGEGEFATVYSANINGKQRAIKIPKRGSHKKIVHELKREARILSALSSNHFTQAHLLQASKSKRDYFLILDMAKGQSLDCKIRSIASCSTEEKCKSKILNIASSLSTIATELSAAQIIWNDIKPENIVYEMDSNTVTLIDAGSARDKTSQVKSAPAAPSYSSPESFNRTPRALSDLYSIGVVLYELIEGHTAVPDLYSNPYGRSNWGPKDYKGAARNRNRLKLCEDNAKVYGKEFSTALLRCGYPEQERITPQEFQKVVHKTRRIHQFTTPIKSLVSYFLKP